MLNLQRHVAKVNAVWDMPDLSLADGGAKRIVGYIVNDWQLSGIFTGNSGNRYDLGYSFQSNGANRNLTGSPDYGARIVYVGDPGAGCTDDQYGQFNVASVTAPTYWQRRPRIGPQHHDRLPEQDGRPLPGAHDPPGRRPRSSSSVWTRSTRSTR